MRTQVLNYSSAWCCATGLLIITLGLGWFIPYCLSMGVIEQWEYIWSVDPHPDASLLKAGLLFLVIPFEALIVAFFAILLLGVICQYIRGVLTGDFG